jgi:ABC-type multidrug transport system ATPase subunit
MKQKLLAAMALATEAPVLVCDEPTANLDGEARAAFFDALAERPSGSIVVLCSHRIEEVQKLVCRVVEMGDGRVVRDAPLGEMLRDLQAFRVEVSLRDGADAVDALLRARGFLPCGRGRLGADVAQHEKVEVVTRLLAEHSGVLSDLSIVPIDDLSHVVSRQRPHLKVVSS